jgi:hypothetical protein
MMLTQHGDLTPIYTTCYLRHRAMAVCHKRLPRLLSALQEAIEDMDRVVEENKRLRA